MFEMFSLFFFAFSQIVIVLAIYFGVLLLSHKNYNVARITSTGLAAMSLIGSIMNGSILTAIDCGIAIIIVNIHAHLKIKRLPLIQQDEEILSDVKEEKMQTVMKKESYSSCRWCGKYFVKGEQVAVCKHCESFYHVSCVKKHVGCRCGSKDFYVRNMKQEESTETKEDAIPVEEGELSREENINMYEESVNMREEGVNMREESVNIEPTDNMETESIKENSHLTEKNKHFRVKWLIISKKP